MVTCTCINDLIIFLFISVKLISGEFPPFFIIEFAGSGR